MKNIFSYFRKHKHRLATVALIFGFFVDIITFRNLNLTLALYILSAHLAIVALTILILELPFKEKKKSFFTRVRAWLPVAQQYSMGNLLSAFLVLYSASASLVASWPFLALVAVAAIGNEVLKLENYRLPFQTTLFFLNLLLFSALTLPVVVGSISAATFLLSLIAGAAVFQIFRLILQSTAKNAFTKNRSRINGAATITIALLALFYFTNVIPPIPLAAKQSGFYHSVQKSGDIYRVDDEPRSFAERYFDFSGTTLHLAEGERAYLYVAVFAPARLGTEIVHRWQFFNEQKGVWTTKNVTHFPILGGRKGGYRGYSFTENPTPGRWRVSVETTRGQVITRTYLTVVRVDVPILTIPTKIDG